MLGSMLMLVGPVTATSAPGVALATVSFPVSVTSGLRSKTRLLLPSSTSERLPE